MELSCSINLACSGIYQVLKLYNVYFPWLREFQCREPLLRGKYENISAFVIVYYFLHLFKTRLDASSRLQLVLNAAFTETKRRHPTTSAQRQYQQVTSRKYFWHRQHIPPKCHQYIAVVQMYGVQLTYSWQMRLDAASLLSQSWRL